MEQPTAVLTGGAGFLGSHLCDFLLEHDYSVICVDNLITGRLANIEHLSTNKFFKFIQADVSDDLKVRGSVDFVLHFASLASPLDYARLPIETLKVGSLGTLHALELAHHKGAKFMMASTSEVYGDPLHNPQKEEHWGNVNPIGPRSMYDESKRFSEALTMAYHRKLGVDTRIVRIFNTYGPRMKTEDGRIVPNLITQALAARPMTAFTAYPGLSPGACQARMVILIRLRAVACGVAGTAVEGLLVDAGIFSNQAGILVRLPYHSNDLMPFPALLNHLADL